MTVNNVGIHEAKTHFSKLIDSVKKGQKITITQRGHPVAILAPVDDQDQVKIDRQAAIKMIHKFLNQQKPMGSDEFEQLLKENQK